MLVENPVNSSVFDQDTGASPERYTSDQVAILESTAITERAAEMATESPAGTSLSPDDFIDGIEVESTAEGGLITVVATGAEPETAVLMADSLMGAYEELKEAESARSLESAIEEFDASIQAVDEEVEAITAEITALREPAAEGTDVNSQIQTAIGQLLELIAANGDAAQLEPILTRLQALQLIQSLGGGDPAMASLSEARAQALERRSQLALARDQLRVQTALTSTGISMVSPARATGQAIPLPRAIVVGLLLGGAIGVAVAFARSSRSRRFQHRDEPELLLHAPLLAEIPDFTDQRTDVPARDARHSAAAESFRVAEAAVRGLNGDARNPGVVALVSAGAGDGVSVVTANLAATAASRGGTVLAIDCDFGAQNLSRLLGGQENHPGITDVIGSNLPLTEAVSTVEVGPDATVDLLGRGLDNVTATTFFRSASTEHLFAELHRFYDLILVDVPSPLAVAYAGSVLRLCSTVMVVPDQAELSVVVDAMDRLALSGATVQGYIYNRSPLPSRPTRSGEPSEAKGVVDSPRARS